MKRKSFFANLYATVFVVVFCALVGGGLFAVESTGFFRGRWGGPLGARQLDMSDYRPRAKTAFFVGAALGGVVGVVLILWRPRRPARFDD
jgi:hypothetical protein